MAPGTSPAHPARKHRHNERCCLHAISPGELTPLLPLKATPHHLPPRTVTPLHHDQCWSSCRSSALFRHTGSTECSAYLHISMPAQSALRQSSICWARPPPSDAAMRSSPGASPSSRSLSARLRSCRRSSSRSTLPSSGALLQSKVQSRLTGRMRAGGMQGACGQPGTLSSQVARPQNARNCAGC